MIGTGPVVVLRQEQVDPKVSPVSIVTGTGDGRVVALGVSRLPAFLVAHRDALFVSPDDQPIRLALAEHADPARPEAEILWAALGAGRWIDLGLLDLLLRAASGDSVFVCRSEGELPEQNQANRGHSGEVRAQNTEISYRNVPDRDRIVRLLGVAHGLAARAECFAAEVARPDEPEYRLRSPTPDGALALRHSSPFILAVLANRVNKDLPLPPQAAKYLHRRSPSTECVRPDAAASEPTSAAGHSDGAGDPKLGEGVFCGAGTALRGTIALDAIVSVRACGGGQVGLAGLASLREVAEERYRAASRELRSCAEAFNAFRWEDGGVVRDQGRIKTTKAMRGWLPRAAERLVDRWGVSVQVPQATDGYPTRNPEHWGCWASCDRALWAWRELSRMAEVIDFATSAEPPAPRYELVPRLRSFGPNLEVYRRLGLQVLRPRRGHVFLAGRVRDLRLRCFAAVGLRRGYFHRERCRLAGHLLSQQDPVDEIAAGLYVAEAVREARNSCRPEQTGSRGSATTTDEGDGANEDDTRRVAEERYITLRETHSPEAASWRRLVEGLLNAAILGIPDAAVGTFLDREYQAPDTGSLDAVRMLNLLASDVVYELEACLEDRSTDIAWARLGRSAQDELHARLASSDPKTFKARVRNTLSGSAGVGGLHLGTDAHPDPAGSAASPPVSEGGCDLFMIRGQTLGGRFTMTGSRPTVIQQEVLLSADEVMLEVAHSLTAAGHRLLAITGEEFVVEAREGDAGAADAVRAAAVAGATRFLGVWGRAVQVEPCDRW